MVKDEIPSLPGSGSGWLILVTDQLLAGVGDALTVRFASEMLRQAQHRAHERYC